jgi:hypothetical protein
MSAYGTLLKTLINFSGSKLSIVAEEVGYDVSYISKWCNKAKLPASKMAPNINRTLANHFSHEILKHEDLSAFSDTFTVEATPDNLDSVIYHLLKDAYTESTQEVSTEIGSVEAYQTKVLSLANDIYVFFNQELPEILMSYNEPLEVLCTLDVCRFVNEHNIDMPVYPIPSHEINVKIGVNSQNLLANNNNQLIQLYYFINSHSYLAFDFYDNALMSSMNTIIVKDHMAILCALDQYSRIITATVITDPEKVGQIYIRALPAFRTKDLLMHATESEEFFQHGYRTDFYSRDNFQFFLARGFEFLLPVECWESITRTAIERDHDEFMAHIVAQLEITWEEIFEKNTIDFFLLKSSLMKYIEDGAIYFADVVYNLTPEERKLHIQRVLELTKKNPNINFYVIDDEYLPNVQHLLHTSLFNNRRKMFLKNPERYHSDIGPHFYSVFSDKLIDVISEYMDNLRTQPFCFHYDAEALQKFMDKYGTLVERMIDLSAFKIK